ncbi:MAG TPA: hydroxymethylbilane synthase [Terriglobia bacterium]|nr:hydroxymethylbilane synthase [Terriglobia bacterium]
METLVAGSRGSKLALRQAEWVKERLETDGHRVEIIVIQTSGDRRPQASLIQPGSKGLFVKEIEEALARGAIDLAVHSLKDLPVDQPPGLCLAAIPPREDARDVLVSRDHQPLDKLVAGARLSTSSLRRQAQLRCLRPDLQIVPVRGNVDTRIKKMRQGECDGLVLAAAGLRRLALDSLVTQYFRISEICPAVGQGALAIEIRQGDDRVRRAVQPLNDFQTHTAVDAERIVLRQLGGGCQTPIAVHAEVADKLLSMSGVVARPDGGEIIRATAQGTIEDIDGVTAQLASELIEQGARAILQSMSDGGV